jgi:hypothetical protein
MVAMVTNGNDGFPPIQYRAELVKAGIATLLWLE